MKRRDPREFGQALPYVPAAERRAREQARSAALVFAGAGIIAATLCGLMFYVDSAVPHEAFSIANGPCRMGFPIVGAGIIAALCAVLSIIAASEA